MVAERLKTLGRPARLGRIVRHVQPVLSRSGSRPNLQYRHASLFTFLTMLMCTDLCNIKTGSRSWTILLGVPIDIILFYLCAHLYSSNDYQIE